MNHQTAKTSIMNASGQRWNVARNGRRVKHSPEQNASPGTEKEVDESSNERRSDAKLETSKERQQRDVIRMTGVPMQRRNIPELAVNAFDNRRNQAPHNVTYQSTGMESNELIKSHEKTS